MARWRNCSCARCRIHGLMGPAILITVGLLFFIGQMTWNYSFDRTWPVILIVIGIVKLLSDTASASGHVNPWETQPAAQPGGQAPPPPAAPPSL
jgi:cell wall-active antibiotic response 4TMS protein YvqF